jgi:Ni/Fe-hydrogenase subunit HybB-like protein
VFAVVLASGAAASYMRFVYGLGRSTNLTDKFPWGIWVGFDVLCGVGLAAGGFSITAAVYLFNLERYKPIVRPTVLTAYLGYLLVCTALLYDLGRPYRIWHALIMWNPHSVMFEVAWCVMLYTTVLSLEFAPVVIEPFRQRLKLDWVLKILKTFSMDCYRNLCFQRSIVEERKR